MEMETKQMDKNVLANISGSFFTFLKFQSHVFIAKTHKKTISHTLLEDF